MNIKKDRKDIIKMAVTAAVALALLIAVYAAFFSSSASSAEYTDEEEKLCMILSEIEGVGKVSVVINSEGEDVGVVVVCQGADSIAVRSKIISAVKVATGAAGDGILIYKMNE